MPSSTSLTRIRSKVCPLLAMDQALGLRAECSRLAAPGAARLLPNIQNTLELPRRPFGAGDRRLARPRPD